MNYLKIFFLLVFGNLAAVMAQGQSTRAFTVTPSVYPDTLNTPAVIIENPGERAVSESEVQYELKSAQPETKLSIGTASAIPAQGISQAPADAREKSKVVYTEQKVEMQQMPANNPALNPK